MNALLNVILVTMLNVRNVMQETKRNVTKKILSIELFSKELVVKQMLKDTPQKKVVTKAYWLFRNIEQQALYQ